VGKICAHVGRQTFTGHQGAKEGDSMKALVSILKRAQSLTSTISNDEEITQEVLDLATALDAELNELIGLFDPNWTSYEAGYAYDPKLVDIALQLGGKQ
jgi:hypothetical protein